MQRLGHSHSFQLFVFQPLCLSSVSATVTNRDAEAIEELTQTRQRQVLKDYFYLDIYTKVKFYLALEMVTVSKSSYNVSKLIG